MYVHHVTPWGPASHEYRINGGDPIIFDYPQTPAWIDSRFPVPVELNQGLNTIRIMHHSGITELRSVVIQRYLDYIPPPPPRPDGRTATALNATVVIPEGTDWEVCSIWDSSEVMVTDIRVAGTDPNPAMANVRALWDENYLYVLLEVTDSALRRNTENPWEQDSVEVFVSETNHNLGTYREGDGQFRVNFVNYQTFGSTTETFGFRSAARIVEGRGYDVIMAIPFHVITPEYGVVLGFDAQVNDRNEADTARVNVMKWNDPTDDSWRYTTLWGFLTLGGPIEYVPCEIAELYARLPGSPGNLNDVRAEFPDAIAFDMQTLNREAALARFYVPGETRCTVFSHIDAGQTVAFITNFIGDNGANDPHHWNWAPITILPPNAQNVRAGDVLHITGRMGHFPGNGQHMGLRRGLGAGHTLVHPFNFANGAFRFSYTLTPADIENGLTLNWNIWGAPGDALRAGTSLFTIGIDDMVIVTPLLSQDVADSLLDAARAAVNALIAGMLTEQDEFMSVITIPSLVAAIEAVVGPFTPVIQTNNLAIIDGFVVGTIVLTIPEYNLAPSVAVDSREIAVNNRISDVAPVRGVTVTHNVNSPTGYVATFVFFNPYATAVNISLEAMLRDYLDRSITAQFTPMEFRPGLVPTGYVFTMPMFNVGGGYWTVTVPLPGGGIPYWYYVIGGPVTGRVPDPYNMPPSTEGHNPRRNMRTEYSVVRMPWCSEFQHEINNRNLELPHDGPRGQIVSARFDSSIPVPGPGPAWAQGNPGMGPYAGDLFGYLLIYLPPCFDPNRETPYPVVYMAHGWWNDNSDWLNGGGIPQIMDNLIASNLMEPTVVVSINNSRHGLVFTSGAQLTNSRRDLFEYVMPFVEANFNVSDNPSYRAIAGYSLGATWATHIFATNAGDFAFYGVFSPPMGASAAALANAPGRDFPTIISGRGVFATYGYLATLSNTLDRVFNYEVPGGHDCHAWAQLFAIFARDYLWTPEELPLPVLTFDIFNNGEGGSPSRPNAGLA
ncbi:MAG: alpha/beta hydrolase-fold protein, partial [Firmicutes bacterium]|nr:alpha/beta hydrolase-fold protein [Bacillota bacterium]